MKKLLALLTAALLVLSLTACGGEEPEPNDDNSGGIDLPLVDVPIG